MSPQLPVSSFQKFIKKILSLPFLLVAGGWWLVASPASAHAADWTNAGEENPDPAQFKDVEAVFEKVLAIIFPLGGIAVFIMLIVGGFQHLTAGGNPEKTQKAWATITYAIVGLVLLVGIWFILRFIHQFTGVDVTEFRIIQD